jgi:glycosyltransferase involved in cell wall biosynthesis
MGERPLFSIGLATYNRKHALKQCLESVLTQSYQDFELIVGNDYPSEVLSSNVMGVDDPRIRFVNYPQNLGEFGNLKALLELANGRYFTWQFDDDLYAPNFLESVRSALAKFNHPPCVFTSYQVIRGNSLPDSVRCYFGSSQLTSGRQFLRLYLSSKIHTMGLTGVYDTEYLKQKGGLQHLSNSPFALYSEYLLLLQCGLLDRVVYVDAPLVYYRVHEGSWGATNTEVETYKYTARNLVQKGAEVLSNPVLRDDFNQNFLSILRFVFHEFVSKSSLRSGVSSRREAMEFLASLKTCLDQSKGADLSQVEFPGSWRAVRWFMTPFLVSKFKVGAPRPVVNLAYKAHSMFRRDRFFRFK